MKKNRLFMNLKKKLAVFMSLSSLLNTATIKGANDTYYDHSTDDFCKEEDDEDLIESLKLPPMDWWSKISTIDAVSAYPALLALFISACKKISDNSLVVPERLPKEEKPSDAIVPLTPKKVENQIEWSNSLSWADLVKKSQDLWEQQGYKFTREDNPKNMAIKAILKSDEIVYDKPFHVPQGILGPIYAVQKSKIEEKCNNNKDKIDQNIDSLINGKVPLCDCDDLLVDSKLELIQILVVMLQNLNKYMNEFHSIHVIKDKYGVTKLLSFGDILYVFNKLVEKLKTDGHKSPANTASWFFLGATKFNEHLSLDQGLFEGMQLISNIIPVLGLYGIKTPGRFTGSKVLEEMPVLKDWIKFYNEQCQWDFAIPIRIVKDGNVIYQIGNTYVKLCKNLSDVTNSRKMNFNIFRAIGTNLEGQGLVYGALVGGGNFFMNRVKNICGMSNVKDFVAVFTTRLAVYTSRLEPLIKFIGCLDDMYQKSKGNIESLLRNVEKLTGENESIKTARQIITEYSPESEKGKILRQLLDLFKRNYDDSTLDNVLQNANYFKNDLPTVFNDYDEKAVEQKEINYIKQLNDDKEKPEAERKLCYCSLQELNNRLNDVTKGSQDEYNIYYELATKCVSSGRAEGITLAYIVNKYIGATGISADYPKAISALKRLIIRSLNLYPWKELKPIQDRLAEDKKITDESSLLEKEVEKFHDRRDWDEYKSLKNLTEFYVEEGAFDTKILESINSIEKRYIGNTSYNSNYPKAINALKHILKRYLNDCKCSELEFIKNQYNESTEKEKLKHEIEKNKGNKDKAEYDSLVNLAEFYIEEGLLSPQILDEAYNKITGYMRWYDYSEAVKFLQAELDKVKY